MTPTFHNVSIKAVNIKACNDQTIIKSHESLAALFSIETFYLRFICKQNNFSVQIKPQMSRSLCCKLIFVIFAIFCILLPES